MWVMFPIDFMVGSDVQKSTTQKVGGGARADTDPGEILFVANFLRKIRSQMSKSKLLLVALCQTVSIKRRIA